MEKKQEILLETGTGELEVLEFRVGNSDLAINVIKIREILEIENIFPVPQTNPAIIGLTLVRGEVIPLIDMKYVLNNEHIKKDCIKTLLCEFNELKVAFCVEEVKGIHRIPWANIQKPDSLLENRNSLIIGNIELGGRIIMLLDFEKIVTEIAPHTGINEARIENIEKKDRRGINVVLVDDSTLIRKLLFDALTKAGFTSLKFFNDGQQAWLYLVDLANKDGEHIRNYVDIVITDIEMPVMDGHTLTRKIKEHSMLKALPVIIFSSLITDTLRHKGESVNADAQMSKPEIGNLINVIDELMKKYEIQSEF